MKFYVVAGEKSGDKQGALLMRELLSRRPDIEFLGLGGSRMHEVAPQGVEDWTEQAAVIGVVEVLRHARFFLRKLREMEERIVSDQPDALLLIDYPGFNQRLAERIRRRCPSTKLIWFIAPMVWAWHKSRVPKLARILDLMLCTFPFEKNIFEKAGLRAEFVGHPLADDIMARRRSDQRDPHVVGLFPGSRVREIERHFPVFLEVVKEIRLRHPDWKIEISASSPKLEGMMRALARRSGVEPESLDIRCGNYHDIMDRAYAALVTSGTATLEAALHDLPFALVYKVAWGTYLLGRILLRIRFIGMVNILADAPVTRELIQHDFNLANCMTELERLMDPAQREKTLQGMRNAVTCLAKQGGSASRAADAVLSLF